MRLLLSPRSLRRFRWLGRLGHLGLRGFSRLFCGLLVCGLLLGDPLVADDRSGDWTTFRGPHATGAGVADWPDDAALKVTWTRSLGTGYSALAVVDGRLYTGFAADGEDWLGAFDATSGEEIWRLSLGAEYVGHGGSHGGPLATPVVGADRVYAVGGHGRLVAAGLDGDERWTRELSEWGDEPIFGYASSPVILGEVRGDEVRGEAVLVVQAPSRDGTLLYGLDPATGEVLWTFSGPFGGDQTVFQSPVTTTTGGKRQVVASGMRGVYGVSAGGDLLWSHAFEPKPPEQKGRGVNVPLPLGDGRMVVKPDGGSVVALAPGSETTEAWTSRHVGRSYLPPTFHDGIVYGYKGSLLAALDAEDGSTLWRSRSPGDGFVVAADDHLVVLTKRGSLHLAAVGGDGWAEHDGIQLFDDAVWTEPTVAEGAIFGRSVGGLARIDVVPARAGRAASEAKDAWIDTGRPGAHLPDTSFGRFVRSLENAEERDDAVDRFLAGVESFPIVDGEWAHFVYRGPEESVGISGDMVGERAEAQMVRVPGTDLFYYSSRLPRDAWVSYYFYPGLDEAGTPDPRNPRRTALPRQGATTEPATTLGSFFTMPDHHTPEYLEGEAERRGRIETQVVSLEGLEVEMQVPPFLSHLAPDPPPTEQRIRVYLPASYEATRSEPYPLVYVFAGDVVLEALDARRTLDHLLGAELPLAVVVFVDRHVTHVAADATWNFAFHRKSFVERVRPFVEERYRVESEIHYLSFGFGGPIALRTAFAPEADARRVAAIQPFLLDAFRPALTADALALEPASRPEVYLESSRIDFRAAHEAWDISEEHAELAVELRAAGFDVTRHTTSLGYAWSAWTSRLGPAMAFLLTGEARIPSQN